MPPVPPEATAINVYLRLHVDLNGRDLVVSVPTLVDPDVFRALRGNTIRVSWMEMVRA